MLMCFKRGWVGCMSVDILIINLNWLKQAFNFNHWRHISITWWLRCFIWSFHHDFFFFCVVLLWLSRLCCFYVLRGFIVNMFYYWTFYFGNQLDAVYNFALWLPVWLHLLCAAWHGGTSLLSKNSLVFSVEPSGELLLGRCWNMPWQGHWKHEHWLEFPRLDMVTVPVKYNRPGEI